MRAPVISRFVRNAAVTGTAALAIGVGLPVLAGGTTAGAADCTVPRPAAGTRSAFLPQLPASIAAGGRVEFGLEQYNGSDRAYPALAPQLVLFDAEILPGSGKLANLWMGDATVETMVHGQWKRLPLLHGCDSALVVDTSSVAEPVAPGHAHRYLIRLTLAAKPHDRITRIDIDGGPNGEADNDARFRLPVTYPAPTPTPTRTTAKPTPTASRPTPVVDTTAPTSPAATPAATRTTTAPAAPAAELASTGPSSATTFLFAAGAALLALGGGVLLAMRRLARR